MARRLTLHQRPNTLAQTQTVNLNVALATRRRTIHSQNATYWPLHRNRIVRVVLLWKRKLAEDIAVAHGDNLTTRGHERITVHAELLYPGPEFSNFFRVT